MLLASKRVNNLSHMPHEWKSGIVPRSSETGQELDMQLQYLARRIETIATQLPCCGGHERRSLLAVKASLYNVIDKKIAPFFASRDQMYRAYLLKDGSTGGKTAQPETPHEDSGARLMLFGPRTTFPKWPANITPLFKQVMYLLRDLDRMFEASYNQRFQLRVMPEELAAWTKWVTTELPKRMPHGMILTQTTSDLFEVYREAAEVHAYYNAVLKRIAKETGAEWRPAPLKKIFRICEKAEHKKHTHEEDSIFFECSKIFDIVRGTLVYDKLGDEDGGVLRGVRTLFDCTQFQVIRIKDRFTNPTSACWRDVLINGRMKALDGNLQPHIVEVQFHHKDLREERMNVGGHYIYERHRALFEACEEACGDEASEILQNLSYVPPRRKSIATPQHAGAGNHLEVKMQTKSGAKIDVFSTEKYQRPRVKTLMSVVKKSQVMPTI